MPTSDPMNLDIKTGLGDFSRALGFLTRIPVGDQSGERPDFRTTAWTFPVVGVVVGLGGGIVFALATALGLSALLSAALAVTTAIILTGAMHEDGLGDTVDGFGGGKTATAKLEIMRDHRIGAYGALALILSIVLRVAALEATAFRGAFSLLLVLVAAEAISRAAMVKLWHDLPSARLDGMSRDAGSPDDRATLTTIAVGGVIALLAAISGAGIWPAIVASAGVAAAVVVFTRMCRNQIGGQTGDTLGAMQQITVVIFLVLIAAFS